MPAGSQALAHFAHARFIRLEQRPRLALEALGIVSKERR
jgi:hypothetical protein